MLFYWGEAVTPDGFALKADSVKPTDTDLSTKSRLRDVSPGKRLLGFICRNGEAYILRLDTSKSGTTGKLKKLDHKKNKIRLINCGETDAVLLAYGGKVLSLEKSNVCRPIKELCSKTVIQVTCGNQHFLALTKVGELFTWGQNSSGQLGLGKDEATSQSPRPLKSLCGIPLAQIRAGGDHSFALSISGAVFGWGRNSNGQLRLGHTENMYIPACVTNLDQKKTISISCGEEHTATLSKGGTVFTFGSGQYGQLGHNSLHDELRPRVVSRLWGVKVSQIACGRHHTLALDKSNTIYSFGCGEQGQLGNRQTTNQSMPLPVQLLQEVSKNHTVERITAGGNLSFALCSAQKCDTELTQINEIVTLENKMIHRWVNECESKQWRMIKKEIKKVFSSAACINGSFIIKSCDRHYQTSANFSGLDMESVETAFKQLARKERLLWEVKKVIETDLLPSLSSTVAGPEALRVFLILLELLNMLNNKVEAETKVTASYASAISKLDPQMLAVLENYLSELPETFLKRFVKLFQSASAKLISKMVKDHSHQNDIYTSLQEHVQLLQMFYKVSCRTQGQRNLRPEDFIITEINDLLNKFYEYQQSIYYQVCPLIDEPLHLTRVLEILSSVPCIFTLKTKCRLLRCRATLGPFRIALRRTALLEDSFMQLRDASRHALKGWLEVVYCENYEKSDVNKRDFFYNAIKMLLNPESKMFMYNDAKTLVWFPAELSLPLDKYFFLGLLCGLAFYNNSVLHIPLPLALFKKLLDIKPSLDDLIELSPVQGRSLQYLLDYTDDDVDNMYMIYTIIWNNKQIKLDPDKPEKAVTSANKKDFVDRFVDYVFNKSVEQAFQEFKRGFYKVCDQSMVALFQPEELRGVMLGSEEYDWNLFKQNATYEWEFYKDHPTIVLFWEVFEELSAQDKRDFLLFLTGFDRVPILGMEQVKMKIRPLLNSTQDHLPQSLTCHTFLDLPKYQTKEIFQRKLTEAIHHRRGCWED